MSFPGNFQNVFQNYNDQKTLNLSADAELPSLHTSSLGFINHLPYSNKFSQSNPWEKKIYGFDYQINTQQQSILSQESFYYSQEVEDNFKNPNSQPNSQVQLIHSQELALENFTYHDNTELSATQTSDQGYSTQLDHSITQTVRNDMFYNRINMLALTQQGSIEYLQNYINVFIPVLTTKEIIEKLNLLKSRIIRFKEKNVLTIVKKSKNQRQKFFNEKEEVKLKCIGEYKKTCRNVFRSHVCVKFISHIGIILDPDNRPYCRVNTKKLNQFCQLIDKLIFNLKNRKYVFIRDIFYENRRLYHSPKVLKTKLDIICSTIGLSRVDLNMIADRNSFICGHLKFTIKGNTIDCSISSPVNIPDNIKDIIIHPSSAHFILLVEKYTTFHHMLTSNVCEKYSIIMITGCGYPSLKTRSFVRKLWFELKLPIFILIDGDAYGIDIALSYKYGSISSACHNHHLVVPEIRWLGITPQDIYQLNLQGTAFDEKEIKKFNSLLKREDVRHNSEWYNGIYHLKMAGIKVELQALNQFSSDFLVDYYLPYKFYYGSWL